MTPPHDPLDRLLGASRLAETRALRQRLLAERVVADTTDPRTLALLRRDVERHAAAMEGTSGSPAMLWSGIPFPDGAPRESSDDCLVISVGGTRTGFALMRLDRGEVCVVGPDGREARGEAAAAARKALAFSTPTQRDVPDGLAMLDRIAAGIARSLKPARDRLARCAHVLVSWGFAHDVRRTAPSVLGGLTARTTLMTKDQAAFTRDLAGKDLGELLGAALERHFGLRAPVTVANDGVMALHYFLDRERRERYARFGLFINGTGTNFAAAEPYAVRPGGVVSRPGESYEPERITRHRPLRPGESAELYFVNYETGSLPLEATRTPYDLPGDYPIEENALSGGVALPRFLEALVRGCIGEEVWGVILDAWRQTGAAGAPRGPLISRLAAAGEAAIAELLPAARLGAVERESLVTTCRAILARSAQHVALILAAVTARNGYGRGDAGSGKPDLFAMEGSVWSSPGYADIVRAEWERLAGAPLRVDFDREKSYDASLRGPLYLAVTHAC